MNGKQGSFKLFPINLEQYMPFALSHYCSFFLDKIKTFRLIYTVKSHSLSLKPLVKWELCLVKWLGLGNSCSSGAKIFFISDTKQNEICHRPNGSVKKI